MAVANFVNFASWIFQVPILLKIALDRIAVSEDILPTPELRTRFGFLWLRYQQNLSSKGINPSGRRAQYYRGLLALHLIQCPSATDAELINLTDGVQVDEPLPQFELSDQQTLATLFTNAEQARNGQGGPMPVRRAQ